MRIAIACVLAGVVWGLGLMIVVAPSAARAAEGDAAWPSPETIDAHGRPEGQIHNKWARFYVFREGEKWTVITTSKQKGKGFIFKGTITVDQGKIKGIHQIGKEKTDFFEFSPNQDKLTFRVRTASAADGFYLLLSDDVQRVHFNLSSPGKGKQKDRIFVGKDLLHPSQHPFVLNTAD